MARRKPAPSHHIQLPLFKPAPPPREAAPPAPPAAEPSTVLEFVRKRFENGPDMTPEEYRHWIRVLIHASLKRLDDA